MQKTSVTIISEKPSAAIKHKTILSTLSIICDVADVSNKLNKNLPVISSRPLVEWIGILSFLFCKSLKMVKNSLACLKGIFYKADQDPDPDLYKKQTLYQKSLYDLWTLFLINLRVLVSISKEFLRILAQKYPNKAFLEPNLGIFVSLQNFVNIQIGGC